MPLDICLHYGRDIRTYELIKLLKQLPKVHQLVLPKYAAAKYEIGRTPAGCKRQLCCCLSLVLHLRVIDTTLGPSIVPKSGFMFMLTLLEKETSLLNQSHCTNRMCAIASVNRTVYCYLDHWVTEYFFGLELDVTKEVCEINKNNLGFSIEHMKIFLLS